MVQHGGNRAYYAQELDYVQMPPFKSFRDAESYYTTLAHELTHWTKHEQRLNRDFGRKRWGDVGCASALLYQGVMLCARLVRVLRREGHLAAGMTVSPWYWPVHRGTVMRVGGQT